MEIAPSSQSIEGGGSAAAAVGVEEGNVVIAYRPTEQEVTSRHRDKGAGAYSSAQALATTSGSNKLTSPTVAVGLDGMALAAWAYYTRSAGGCER